MLSLKLFCGFISSSDTTFFIHHDFLVQSVLFALKIKNFHQLCYINFKVEHIYDGEYIKLYNRIVYELIVIF